LEAVGRFPTNLGRIGSILLSGEGVVVDSIRKAGGRAIFVPQAIVEHNIPKSRLQPKWLMRRMFWQGVTQSEVDKYLVERLGSIAPLQEWRDVRLPVSHKRWEQMFNSYPDSDFNTIIQECYDLGYALQKVGLLGV
jgi:hypothetical protein